MYPVWLWKVVLPMSIAYSRLVHVDSVQVKRSLLPRSQELHQIVLQTAAAIRGFVEMK